MAEGADQEDKTEEPTQKRVEDAVERGDVAKSQELSTFLALGAMTLALLLVSLGPGRSLSLDLRGYLMNAYLVPDSPAGIMSAGERALTIWFKALAIPVGLISAAALAGGLIQHRPLWTFDPLMPKFSRISPLAGLKRLLGIEAFVHFGKGLVKISIVGTLATLVLWREHDRLESFVGLSPGDLAGVIVALALKLLTAILAIHAVVAIADVLYQRLSWMKRLRMSKQELKQELKEQDGNPEVKARLRQLRAQKLRKRMMAAVPQATVVVTNPTHFAVALKYEKGMAAPICVAKGVDALAQRIRTVARESNVPVIENPPLARALHATVEIDAQIPVEHYKAVAEVIGFVLRLRRRAS